MRFRDLTLSVSFHFSLLRRLAVSSCQLVVWRLLSVRILLLTREYPGCYCLNELLPQEHPLGTVQSYKSRWEFIPYCSVEFRSFRTNSLLTGCHQIIFKHFVNRLSPGGNLQTLLTGCHQIIFKHFVNRLSSGNLQTFRW